MYFQEVTPDTSGYMIAGYVIAFVLMGLYVASMYLRSRNLKQDMTMLEEMEKSTPPPVHKKSVGQPATTMTAETVTKSRTKK
ncbi:MAG: hypothetical protein ACM3Y8_12860 [Byssovorax cruenta]